MKTTLVSHLQQASRRLAMLVAVVGTLALAGNARAQSNWINTTTGTAQSWGTAGNWSTGAVPNAAGAVVNITSNIAADQVITISSTSRTVGTLNIGDPDGSNKWNLTRSSSAVLIFDVSSGSAALNLLAGAKTTGYQMNTPIQLNDDLVFTINVLGGDFGFTQPITESGGDRTFTLTSTVAQTGINTFAGVNGFNKLVVSGNAIFNNNLLASDRALGKVHGSYLADAITLDAGTLRAAATGNYTISGNRGLTLGSGGGTLNAPAIGRNWVVDSIITGSGGLTKSGPGDATLNAVNTYLGNTTVAEGRLVISSAAALPGFDTAGRYSVAAGAALMVTNTVVDADVAAIVSADNFASGGSIGFDTAAGNREYVAAISDTATGGLGLLKQGANTLTLSGVNTYTGATNIAAGTLALGPAGSIANSAGIFLSAATSGLDLSAASGGGISIGTGKGVGGLGTITGNLSLASGAGLVLSSQALIAGAPLTVTGTVSLPNDFGISSLYGSTGQPFDFSLIPDGTYTLINNGSSFANITNFGAGNAADIGGGRTAYFTDGSLNLTVVPEPGTSLALATGLVAAASWWRGRRRSG